MSKKVALVTGASQGIGRATALMFALKGLPVVLSDINSEAGKLVEQDIRDRGGDAFFIEADVSNSADVSALIEATVQKYGRLDVAHNNAGIGPKQLTRVHEFSESDWASVLEVNLTGVWLCMKYELQHMVERDSGGAIVNTASMAGLAPVSGSSAYTASKFGVVGISKGAALEYAPRNIRVNAICPGYIETPMTDEIMRKNKASRNAVALNSRIPLGQIGNPDDVAAMVTWLCSDEARYVTGQAISIDGGISAQGLGPTGLPG